MTPSLRKFALTAHVTFSVGWFGAVAAFLALAIAGLTAQDPPMVRAAYLAMAFIGWWVIVPCSFAALLTRVDPIIRHRVGTVPALLDPGEIPADRRCGYSLAAAHAAGQPLGGSRSAAAVARRGHACAAGSTRGRCRCRTA